ncbi:MAG: hypothetical protein ABIG20_01765 [archaeon]
MMWELFLIGSYAFLGGGIKYIDQVFDEEIFNKYCAYTLAVMCGGLMGYLVAIDNISATIFLSLILSLGIMRKIDNMAFYIGAIMVVLVPMAITHTIMSIIWTALGLLILASIADEGINEIIDRRQMVDGLFVKIAYYRPIMKLIVIALVIGGWFPLLYAIAFFAFDISYSMIEQYSFWIRRRVK